MAIGEMDKGISVRVAAEVCWCAFRKVRMYTNR
jgi:hypothetical protein